MRHLEQQVETPHLVGALLADGTAHVMHADSYDEATHLVALLQAGAFGHVRAVCYGELREADGEDRAAQTLLQRLIRRMTIH